MKPEILLAKKKAIALFVAAEMPTQISPMIIKYENYGDLQYDTNWNQLMPVVRKIVEICIENGSTGDGELFMSDEYTAVLDTVPLAVIDDAFRVVAEFVEFYEKLQK